MYGFDDLLEDLNASSSGFGKEIFSKEDLLSVMSPEEVAKIFPRAKLANRDSSSVAYVPVKMCHSLPTVNHRGRCFTPGTMIRSYETARDQLVNLDHKLVDNSLSDSDSIIGHIKDVAVPSIHSEAASEIANIPDEPMPLYALTCLFLRGNGVRQMLEKHLSGKEKWLTSMECGHDFREAELLYDGNFIPLKDADSEMLRCVKQDHVEQFRGKDLSLCLGGTTGKVNWWGLGMTQIPADEGASILGIYAGNSFDVASRSVFYMPCEMREIACSGKHKKNVAEIEKHVDTILSERANISVLGETDPSPSDGHTHLILSDLTVVPKNGHSHYLEYKTILPGKKTKLNGRTDIYSRWIGSYEEERREDSHLHLVNIDLRSEYKPENTTSSEISNMNITGETEMKLSDVINRLESLLNNSSDTRISSELASLRSELSGAAVEEEIASRVEAEISNRIESGDILTKEVAEKAVEEAVAEVEEKHEKDKQIFEKRQSRIDLCNEANIDLSAVFDEEIKDENGNPLTIGSQLESFGVDEEGDKQFKLNLSMWKKLAVKKDDEQASEEASRRPSPQIVGSSTGRTNDKKGKENKSQDKSTGRGASRFAKFIP